MKDVEITGRLNIYVCTGTDSNLVSVFARFLENKGEKQSDWGTGSSGYDYRSHNC
jgi:hypothetical protein